MKNNNNILNNNEIRQDLHTTNRDNGDRNFFNCKKFTTNTNSQTTKS